MFGAERKSCRQLRLFQLPAGNCHLLFGERPVGFQLGDAPGPGDEIDILGAAIFPHLLRKKKRTLLPERRYIAIVGLGVAEDLQLALAGRQLPARPGAAAHPSALKAIKFA